MSLTVLLSFIVTTTISTCLIPVVNKAANILGIVAHMNERTIHDHEIARIGGFAIYISSLIGSALFLKTDNQINAILIAGFIIFMVGLYDDAHNLSPKIKLIFELVSALIVIFYGGIYIKGFVYAPSDAITIFSGIVTILWIVGITNAINLIDGLDGLSAGISIIVLITISITSILSGRSDIASLALVLAGSILGFLFFNFHPAKIFMGDCGALYIGFMISVISLLGFGYSASTFFTLGAPIIVLMVPIMDTLIAIVRRKLHHKKFSDADRGHLHHNLMFKLKLGQRKSVLILYFVTFLFSLTSYLYYFDPMIGIILFVSLMIMFEIFIEITNMISRKYKPLLTVLNIFIKSDELPKIKVLENYRNKRTLKQAKRDHILVALSLVLVICISLSFIRPFHTTTSSDTPVEVPYQRLGNTEVLNNIYGRLNQSYLDGDKEEESQLVAAYFACDYYTLSDKDENDIGGIEYIYSSLQESFRQYASFSFYTRLNTNRDLEVVRYNIISYSPSKVTVEGLEDQNYYNVLIHLTFNEEIEDIDPNVNITVVEVDGRYYVCGVDNI